MPDPIEKIELEPLRRGMTSERRSAAGVGCALLLALLGWGACRSQSETPNEETGRPETSAPAPHPAAGHWEGSIALPATALAIRVDLERSGATWQGTIDIPVQGLRGFSLGAIEIADGAVGFQLPGVPGDPTFRGTLSSDGQRIAGEFAQGGQSFAFQMARAERTPERAATPARGAPGEGFTGAWQGSLRVQASELRLLLELEGEDAALAGQLTSIDQGASRIPIARAEADGGRLHLEIPDVGAVFDGETSTDGSEITGTWEQNELRLPLTFKRLERAPDLSRPQDPSPPVPYREQDVRFENPEAGIRLAGTFTWPRGEGPHPAVVLLSGSGPQDRDEAIAGHRPFLVLADHLTRGGIAVLRFDDRGFAASEGEFSTATSADFVSDALAAVSYLQTRDEVDGTRIGLIGHSEGGVIAPRAAVRSDGVAFLVLLAGVGVPLERLLVRQARDIALSLGATQEGAEAQLALQREIFSLLKNRGKSPQLEGELRALLERAREGLPPELLEAIGASESLIDAQLQTLQSPWFRDLLTIDPGPTLERIRCPVLAMGGSKDVQVAARENLEAIEESLRRGGNANVTVVELPGLNHLFQTAPSGAIAEYAQIEETFSPDALERVTTWIRETAGLE